MNFEVKESIYGNYIKLTNNDFAGIAEFMESSRIDYLSIDGGVTDDSFIDQLSPITLKRFISVGGSHIKLSKLEKFVELESLDVARTYSEKLSFKNFSKLKSLSIEWNPKLIDWDSLEELNYLNLTKVKSHDLSFLRFPKLKHLSLVSCIISSFSGVENLLALEKLEIYSAKGWTSLNSIGNLKKLRSLKIEKTDIKNLDFLEGCVILEELVLDSCKDIESISALVNLSKLSKVKILGSSNIIDGDLGPLAGKSNVFVDKKKHYTRI